MAGAHRNRVELTLTGETRFNLLRH